MYQGSYCETYSEPIHTDVRSEGYDEAKQEMLAGRPTNTPLMAAGWVLIVVAIAVIITMVSRRTGQWLPSAIDDFVTLAALGVIMLLVFGAGLATLSHLF